ncbi:cytochrome c oxidase subunit 1 [Mortierella alpina]|uniref:Cytochrome c oxidase subunit 1 n=1 Tax=Mortierella alpina TaxID=64518 RepID=A0A9P6JEG2_MORAP|nr:cytochrome c oxidase subunit 1 [Mortierella alpina]
MAANGGGTRAMSLSDHFFSYETFKVLRVHDRRLGGLYRLFQATILLYIASSIIYQQRYLKTENVINGAVRVTLKAPADGVATPDYCSSTPVSCLHWDENDILYEPGVDGALITTRAQITQYGPFANQSIVAGISNQCDINLPTVAGCDPDRAPSTLLLPTSLVADIERFTLMLEHSIRGQASGVQIRSGNMDSGVLRNSRTGEVAKVFTDEFRHVPASALANKDATPLSTASPISQSTDDHAKTVHLAGDVMTVGEFLRAAGVDLDELSASPTAAVNETVRSSGVVVIVVIQYAAKGWNPNRISYEYLPKAIPDQEYKVIETIRDFRAGSRVEINRHGIRILFSQAGQLGQFSLMTLLTNLVAAVALFKVANIIVELLMLRLHPQKKTFTRAKFASTKDITARREDKDGMREATVAGRELRTEGNGQVDEAMAQASLHNATREPSHRRLDAGAASWNKESRKNEEDAGFAEEGDNENDDHGDNDSCSYETTESDSDAGYVVHGRVSGSRTHHLSSRRPHTCSTFNTTDSLHRRPRTPLSIIDPAAKQPDGDQTVAGVYSWNRNGSSSALSGDITPGVARTTFHGAGLQQHSTDFSDDAEIETPFGPVHPHSYKGFNPGGLSLSASPSFSPSPPRTRAAPVLMRGVTTPQRGQGQDSFTPTPSAGESVVSSRSPAAMQAVSPSPVHFGHQRPTPRETCCSGSTHERRRSKRQGVSKQGESSSITPQMGTLTSRLSSSSLSSLTSSASSSSLSSACGESVCSVGQSGTGNVTTSLGQCSGAYSSTGWPFGAADSPLQDCSSGGEGISRTESRPGDSCKVTNGAAPASGRGNKKPRKEYYQAGTSRGPSQRSYSEASLTRPVFALDEGSSHFSSHSLTASSSALCASDVKGKQRDHSGDVLAESSSVSKSQYSSTSSLPSQWCSSAFSIYATEGLRLMAGPSGSVKRPEESSPRLRASKQLPLSANSGAASAADTASTFTASSTTFASTLPDGHASSHTSGGKARSNSAAPSFASPSIGLPTHSLAAAHSGSSTVHSGGKFHTSPITTSSHTAKSFSSSTAAKGAGGLFDSATHITGNSSGSGIRVLGRTITMITADNKKLLLRRSEPLVLNEGVGEEKAARM